MNSSGTKIDSTHWKIISAGIAFAVFFWIFDSAIDTLFFERTKGAGFVDNLLHPEAIEIWMRVVVIVLGVCLGLYTKHHISLRMRAEEDLRESEERYRRLFENESDAVMIFDAETLRFEDANQATLDLFGYTREEFLRITPLGISGEKEKTSSAVQGVIEGRPGSERVPLRYLKKKDGTVFPGEISAGGFSSKGRKKIIGAIRDITERKRMEDEKERLQDQLIQAQKMEAIGTLAGGIAHDFNNIMTAIKSLTSLALSKIGEKDRMKEYLEPVRDVSERAINLVQQLLIFSQNRPVELAALSLNSAIDELSSMLESLVSEDISIEKELGQGLWNIEADKGRMEQVILNLVVNGRDAMPGGGSITLRTENVTLTAEQSMAVSGGTPGDFVRLTVEDTGQGMNREIMGHIFEPFYTTKAPGGTGLGLSVVYGIIRELKGWVDVSSEPGQGAKFMAYIPASTRAVDTDAVEPVREKAIEGGGKRILLVEDELWVRKSTAMVLSDSGYKVFEAAGAEDAAEIFLRENGKLDLVLTDVVMAGKSGIEMAMTLRDTRPGMPVLFFSGHLEERAELERITRDGFSYIHKPYEIPDLLQAVEDAIGRGS